MQDGSNGSYLERVNDIWHVDSWIIYEALSYGLLISRFDSVQHLLISTILFTVFLLGSCVFELDFIVMFFRLSPGLQLAEPRELKPGMFGSEKLKDSRKNKKRRRKMMLLDRYDSMPISRPLPAILPEIPIHASWDSWGVICWQICEISCLTCLFIVDLPIHDVSFPKPQCMTLHFLYTFSPTDRVFQSLYTKFGQFSTREQWLILNRWGRVLTTRAAGERKQSVLANAAFWQSL